VTEILRQWGAGEDLRVAGLLHDAWEDHPDKISMNEIRMMFGERVAHLVYGVSGSNDDIEDPRKVAREAQTELGIVLLKCADRLHNLRTMNGFDEKKKIRKAKETLKIYVPMAESLGLWQIKNALADMAFSFANPIKYEEVKQRIDGDPRLNSEFIHGTKKWIQHILDEAGLRAIVEHQVGGYWELFEKKKKTRKEYRDITDVVSFRVVFDDEENLGECYRGMGIVRTKFGEAICLNRSDDFLAVPALNLYSALHDTYKLKEGNIEVAFTTKGREAFNNWGVASLSQEELQKDMEKYKISLRRANKVY
jgi:guanosine-3',5'-bis(diphosphate) 3'-pyrophosphohydrolase